MNPAFSRETLLPERLPDWRQVLADGAAAGRALSRPRTAFHRHRGVASQHDWALRCRAEGRARTIMNIGLPDWTLTKAALGEIWDGFTRAGLEPPDAYQLILERRMGLPAALRRDAPQETGPALWGEDDWMDLGRTVPIQPQAPLIGGPASLENALSGLAAGLETVGNFSNFVNRYPYWDDEVAQAASVLGALGALSAFRAQGAVMDSYLEDGHPGVFADYRSIVGWALFERRIVTELCGANYAPAFGGLTADPFARAAVYRAHQLAGPADALLGGYFHGGTIGHTASADANLALFVNDATVSLAATTRFGWGAAYLPVPLSERERVPATEEIAEVHRLARTLEPHATELARHIDWGPTEALAAAIAADARAWLGRLEDHLAGIGIDLANPLELMLATRRMGAAAVERIGLGAGAEYSYPTELTRTSLAAREHEIARVRKAGLPRLDGRAVAVASTDVHAFAKLVIEGVLRERGTEVVDGGLAGDPEELLDRALAAGCTALVVTTHNGWALNFGDRLAAARRRRGAEMMLVMGGVLNEDSGAGANAPLPRDVSPELRARGIHTTNDLAELVTLLADVGAAS